MCSLFKKNCETLNGEIFSTAGTFPQTVFKVPPVQKLQTSFLVQSKEVCSVTVFEKTQNPKTHA